MKHTDVLGTVTGRENILSVMFLVGLPFKGFACRWCSSAGFVFFVPIQNRELPYASHRRQAG